MKNVKKNAIFFKLFWYEVFVHWKLKLLNILVDSVLISFVFSLWIINEFEKDKETNDFWWNITWSKMPKGRRWTSWLFYKRGRAGFELGTTEKKSSQQSERELNLGPPKYKFIALAAVNGKITALICVKQICLSRIIPKFATLKKLLC